MRLEVVILALALPGLPASASDNARENACLRFAETLIDKVIVEVESSANPFAIGIKDGRLARQPRNQEEATATASALEKAGYSFSMGCRQIHRSNLKRYQLDYRSVFDADINSKVGRSIFEECHVRAQRKGITSDQHLRSAIACYGSGSIKLNPDPSSEQARYIAKVMRRLHELQPTEPRTSAGRSAAWDAFGEISTLDNTTEKSQ